MTRILQTKVETGARLVAKDITNLTFFPVGSILMFSYAAWQSADAEFKAQWRICDGSAGTVNLVNRFPRGTNSSTGQTGGTDIAQVPYHTHGVSDSGHSHKQIIYEVYGDDYGVILSGSIPVARHETIGTWTPPNTGTSTSNISIGYSGAQDADNRPAFTSVIFIQKVA
jgi:hypothetical protein